MTINPTFSPSLLVLISLYPIFYSSVHGLAWRRRNCFCRLQWLQQEEQYYVPHLGTQVRGLRFIQHSQDLNSTRPGLWNRVIYKFMNLGMILPTIEQYGGSDVVLATSGKSQNHWGLVCSRSCRLNVCNWFTFDNALVVLKPVLQFMVTNYGVCKRRN